MRRRLSGELRWRNRGTFHQRHVEHAQWWLSGFYGVYDPVQFTIGKKQTLIKGIGDPKQPGRMAAVIAQHVAVAPLIGEFLRALQIMVSRYDGDKRTRRLIEGGQSQESIAIQFLGKDFSGCSITEAPAGTFVK